MKQFRATFRSSGMIVATVVFAQSTLEGQKTLVAPFGSNKVIGIPKQMGR